MSERLENEFGVNSLDGGESIYLCVGVKKTPIEFDGDVNISDGARTSQGVTSRSGNYEDAIRYITISPLRSMQEGEHLTEDGQIALRSELLAGLMRIARIARPGALYYSLVSGQTSKETDETIINPIDCEEVVGANLAAILDTHSHHHKPGYGGFVRVSSMSPNRINSIRV